MLTLESLTVPVDRVTGGFARLALADKWLASPDKSVVPAGGGASEAFVSAAGLGDRVVAGFDGPALADERVAA